MADLENTNDSARSADTGSKLATLGQVKNVLDYSKNKITELKGDLVNMDVFKLENIETHIGLLNVAGSAWSNLSNVNHKHFAIPIKPYSVITIKSNTNSDLFYACLTKYDLTTEPSLADGFTGRKTLSINNAITFRSGYNANFLYLTAINNGLDCIPSELIINDYSLTDTLKENINSLLLHTKEYVTPQMYGAVVDGVHDDLEAIQKAVDNGGNIYFPKGIYLVTNTIHVVKSNTHLILNPQAIIKCDSVTTSDPEYGNGGATINFGYGSVNENDVPYINDVGIEGGTVRNTSTGDNENAIGFSHVNKFYVRNVTIPECNRKGITAQYWCRNGIIENNKIMSCGYKGISIEFHSDFIDIVHNFIQNDKAGAIVISNCEYIRVSENNIRQATGIGIQATKAGVDILNNTVFASSERCISVNEDGDIVDEYPVNIIGNTVRSNGAYSIYVSSKSKPVIISNNKDLNENLSNGFLLYNANGIVSGNIVKRFLLSHANGNTTIIGNKFNRLSINDGDEHYAPIIIGNTIEEEYGGNYLPTIYFDILNNELHSSIN